MANPLYQQLFGGGAPVQGTSPNFLGQQMPARPNPMQMTVNLMKAMMNPAAFVRQIFPDIPQNIANDSNQVFNYLQQTRPQVSQQQIQEAQQTAGQIIGQGTVR